MPLIQTPLLKPRAQRRREAKAKREEFEPIPFYAGCGRLCRWGDYRKVMSKHMVHVFKH